MNVVSSEQMGGVVNRAAPLFRPFKRAVPRPELIGTGVFLLGLVMTYATLTGNTPSAVARSEFGVLPRDFRTHGAGRLALCGLVPW